MLSYLLNKGPCTWEGITRQMDIWIRTVSLAEMKHSDQKASWGGSLHFLIEGSQGRNSNRTAEWRKIIFFFSGILNFFLLCIVNVYRTGFHKEFVCCVTSGHFHTRTYYTLNIFPPMPLPSSPLCPPVSLLTSCHIRQGIRSFDDACTPEKV